MLAAAALAACSKDGGEGGDEGENVAIRLSAGVPSAVIQPDGKAPVADEFVAQVAGWEAEEGEQDYSVAPTWQATATIPVPADETAITLNPGQVYDGNDAIKTYMVAWYPAGTLTDGVVAFDKADGTNDAMITTPIFGSKWDNEGKNLAFTRETSQSKFKVVGTNTLVDATSIRAITLKDVEAPSGFDLTGTQPAVTYAAEGNLPVPNVTEAAITTTAADAGEPVMVKALKGNQLGLLIETSVTTYDVTATIDGDTDFVPGKAYTITLTFGQEGVALTASVSAWDYSGTGSVDGGVIK